MKNYKKLVITSIVVVALLVLQSPKCTSTLTDYGSGTSIVAYCIPIN